MYNRSAQYHGPYRNPVILIPGILGSKLTESQTDRIVWGAFSGDYADPHNPADARLSALPMSEGTPLRALRDSVVPNGVLDRVKLNLFFLPIELKAYAYLLRVLGIGGYRDETLGFFGGIDYGDDHFTCFQFDYDWRRDNVENAIRFHTFILEKKAYVQSEIKKRFGIDNPDVKFDIVAYSMGGLIARYYLRYGPTDLPPDGSLPPVTWVGSEYVERVILIGTPNGGSARTFYDLVHGYRVGFFLPTYPAALLGTFPSIYQLLPRGRHHALVEDSEPRTAIQDIFTSDLWKKMGWGLADPEQDWVLRSLLPNVQERASRRRIALEHQQKCLKRARQFCAALDVPALPPERLELYLFAGDGVPTDAVLAVDRKNRRLRTIEKQPGDGTVLRSSTLMDERMAGAWVPHLVSPLRFKQVTFLSANHLDLTRNPELMNNLLFVLLEDVR